MPSTLSSTGGAISWAEHQHRSRPHYGIALRGNRTCVRCGRVYDYGGHKYCSWHCRDDVRKERRAAQYPAERQLWLQKKAESLKHPKIALEYLPICPVCKQLGPLNYRGTCSDRCLQAAPRTERPLWRKKRCGLVQGLLSESQDGETGSWADEAESFL
jgi:predicted nucleic acid-binding Zn ribbon protein